jgi:D-lactate dehydrogenase
MVTIAFFEIEQVWEKKYFQSKLKKHKLIFSKESLTKKNVSTVKNADILVTFIHSKINKNIISKLPKLKLITTMSTGFDHIDRSNKKITVTNVPAYGENTVAEQAFALVLMLSRKMHTALHATQKGNIDYSTLTGFDLKGKTLGVIGTGRIGRHMIKFAQGFDMRVIGFDKFKNEKLAKQLHFRYVSLKKLLNSSDVISLHLPLLPSTKHIINSKNINQIKKGAILINTARGALVETKALQDALDKGILSGAGIDVFEEECFLTEDKQLLHKKYKKLCNMNVLMIENKLAKRKDVVATPHNSFNTKEALTRILDTTILNITSFLKKKPVNVVKA